MKIKLPLFFLLIFSIVDAQVPSTWDSTTTYSSGALALDSNGVTYIALQDVSAGTALSDTSYWQSLDAAAPTSAPSTSAPTSTPDTSTVPTTTPDTNQTTVSRFLGISTRGLVSSTKAMYGSIAITGTENKTVAFMGKGKTMESQGITDYVADPALIIYKLTDGAWGVYRTIDNWGDATGTENISTVDGEEGITLPVDASEAAIVLDLAPGSYSAILTSTEATAKEALVEAYEIPATDETSRFLGISTRGLVSSTKAMYGSIAITGTENKKVVFMGKGKTMESQGITDYVADPALIIYKLTDGAWGVYKTIDNWGDATGTENISTVDGSEGITLPVDANEAAIVLDLEPGNYSAILTSTEATEKEALVEAYEIVE
tara:strand:+ start:7290 stop:8414 length:1125 start_codon:yes stop_codon:yes gene_type:complete